MRAKQLVILVAMGLLVGWSVGVCQEISGNSAMSKSIDLPKPSNDGGMPLNQALSQRRSRRDLVQGPLTIEQISQILWAAQGITANGGFRTAPSAGALYPIELYVVVENIDGMAPGFYHYSPQENSLGMLKAGSMVGKVAKAALGQRALTEASAIIIIAAEIERSSGKYGDRADRYIAEETGAIAQNIYLQVESLGLSTVLVGAFHDARIQDALGIKEIPYAIMPVGRRSE